MFVDITPEYVVLFKNESFVTAMFNKKIVLHIILAYVLHWFNTICCPTLSRYQDFEPIFFGLKMHY